MSDTASLALRGHFGTQEQQRETAAAGMWIFLVSEVMFFGGLFMAYSVYRLTHPQAFAQASAHMNILLGSINTAVMITSSFTMALAAHASQVGSVRRMNWLLVLTIALGCVFLAFKGLEYAEHYNAHEAPGVWFNTTLADPGGVEMFFVFYFLMTLLHALHMIIGVGILVVLLLRGALGSFTENYHNPVVISGLYWSFVDIVWIFLYAIFYLPGLHT